MPVGVIRDHGDNPPAIRRKENITVRHFDGTVTSVPLADIAEFTSGQNPDNSKNVAIVDIELPLSENMPDCAWWTHRASAVFINIISPAENWLPEVGTALLAINADRPLSENDLVFISN